MAENNFSLHLSSDNDSNLSDNDHDEDIKWTFLTRHDSYDKVKLYFKLLKFRTRTTQKNKSSCRFCDDFGTIRY